jgi:hypothetical protein
MKLDNGKPNIALIPPEVLLQMAEVFGFGAEKYGMNDWRKDYSEWSRTYSSIQRHLNAFWAGEDLDPESGKPHLTHALTQMAILLMYYHEHKDMDDRYKGEEK